MRATAAGLAAVLAALATVTAVASPASVSSLAARTQADASSFELSGKIVSVDYTANLIVVRSHGEPHTIAITPTTNVERDGQPGSIADLRPGLRVHIVGSSQAGQMVAQTIVINGD